MKKINFKLAMLAFGAMVALVSCDNDDNDPNGDPNEDEYALVGGGINNPITEDVTLKAGETYTLEGEYFVAAPACLTIEEGVTIIAQDGNDVAYILIEQGATIEAKGTASNPIVMTSEVQERGAWAGLHICGKAPINATAGTGVSEVGLSAYGGTTSDDNSGALEYVRIENAGYPYSTSTEANGFTFYGVGSGTKVNYIQAHNGADDGIEFFGGTVNAKYVVSSDNKDDAFDWTQGWTGKVQYLVVTQGDGLEADQTIEGDNSKSDYAMTPVSHPTLSNITMIGYDNSSNTSGALLRNGTYFNMYNAIMTGKSSNLVIDGTDDGDSNSTDLNPTDTSLDNGTSEFKAVAIAGSFSNKATSPKYGETEFIAAGNSVGNDFSSVLTGYVGSLAGGYDISADDSFFDATDFIGAVKTGADWTANWTSFE
ncbi:MAG: hypothetical protein R3Y15_01470 [Rikenellaceae bacterium]